MYLHVSMHVVAKHPNQQLERSQHQQKASVYVQSCLSMWQFKPTRDGMDAAHAFAMQHMHLPCSNKLDAQMQPTAQHCVVPHCHHMQHAIHQAVLPAVRHNYH